MATDHESGATTPQPPPGGPRIAHFYMSGDLRAATGLSRTHLDFYLREGIVQPSGRTGSGYLLFDEEELARLRRVIAWREEGVSLRDIRDRLARERGADRVAAEAPAR